ncbi:MAG: class I mannose-6-phosphate isomerase, partial [Verrucomicrobiota bacterium]
IDHTSEGLVLVYGTGAALVGPYDILVYADMARWEIQLRYRRGDIANWCAKNRHEDFLRMYKRGYFVDWRVADRQKQKLFDRIDFYLDTNAQGAPKMVTGEAFRSAIRQVARQPFRLVPYFDSGPWGGQWMKETFQLDCAAPNYAWGFDGVPEENSLLLDFGGTVLEVPAINVVLFQPVELLGDLVHSRFGREFPIRFDFLDTMGGGNLSLQVHPTTEYMREEFGLSYTQDESYYLLEAAADATVCLGLKNGVDPQAMFADLERAHSGACGFEVEKYVNVIPARKHDHFLIPAGTIHCAGRNSVVLEISATPYIFTFKLWDWDRLGMDGKPRPIHIDAGKRALDCKIDSATIHREHINRIQGVSAGDGWREESTGLHQREFIETRRHWFTKAVTHHTNGNVSMLNLVQGEEALVESPTGAFPPFVVHYAETFIVPASVVT